MKELNNPFVVYGYMGAKMLCFRNAVSNFPKMYSITYTTRWVYRLWPFLWHTRELAWRMKLCRYIRQFGIRKLPKKLVIWEFFENFLYLYIRIPITYKVKQKNILMITDDKITEIFCATDELSKNYAQKISWWTSSLHLEHIVSLTTNLRLSRGIILRTLNNSHCSNLIPNWRIYLINISYYFRKRLIKPLGWSEWTIHDIYLCQCWREI